MPGEPRPDAVAHVELHPSSGVLTARLSNGVTLRHREMQPPSAAASGSGGVIIHVSFQRGLIDEPAQDRAAVYAAAAALREVRLPHAEATDLRRSMAALGVKWDAIVAPASVTLAITAPASALEPAFELAWRVAAEGEIDRAAFERARTRLQFAAAQAARVPEQAMTDLYTRAAHPEDDRPRAPTPQQVAALDFERARRFLDHALRAAPIEIAVVGDAPRRRAVDLAARFFGALDPRAASEGRERLLVLAAPPGPVDLAERIVTPDARSTVLEGFAVPAPGPGGEDASAVLAREAVQEALSARLTASLRDRLRLTSVVRVEARPNEGWIGADEFWASATCAVGREGDVARALRDGMAGVAAEPVTDAELVTARQRVAARRAEELADPAFWAGRLSLGPSGRRDLDDLIAAPGRALALTREDLLSAARGLIKPERRISLVVAPKDPPENPRP